MNEVSVFSFSVSTIVEIDLFEGFFIEILEFSLEV